MVEHVKVVTVGEKKIGKSCFGRRINSNGMINSKFIKKQLFQNIIIKS